jgi:hypothetical protein
MDTNHTSERLTTLALLEIGAGVTILLGNRRPTIVIAGRLSPTRSGMTRQSIDLKKHPFWMDARASASVSDAARA